MGESVLLDRYQINVVGLSTVYYFFSAARFGQCASVKGAEYYRASTLNKLGFKFSLPIRHSHS